jgi:c-di-GMP-specific phosphodiesterase
MSTPITPGAALLAELQTGLAQRAFVPVFQPIARLSDGALSGFESLARWQRAAEVLSEPAVFLEAALEHDLLGEISRHVLYAACADMASWAHAAPGVFLTVNVAGRQLEHDDFASDVLRAVDHAGLAGARLRIEVTETQVLRDPARAARHLARLRDQKIGVFFDDFGAGFSSLSWLTRLPVDGLKFDALLTRRAPFHSAERKILRAMISLAHDMGLLTIGEGVEREEERDALMDLGCDYAQGHFFSRPLTAQEAGALMARLPRD